MVSLRKKATIMDLNTSKFDIPYTNEEFDAINEPKTEEEFSRCLAALEKYISRFD